MAPAQNLPCAWAVRKSIVSSNSYPIEGNDPNYSIATTIQFIPLFCKSSVPNIEFTSPSLTTAHPSPVFFYIKKLHNIGSTSKWLLVMYVYNSEAVEMYVINSRQRVFPVLTESSFIRCDDVKQSISCNILVLIHVVKWPFMVSIVCSICDIPIYCSLPKTYFFMVLHVVTSAVVRQTIFCLQEPRTEICAVSFNVKFSYYRASFIISLSVYMWAGLTLRSRVISLEYNTSPVL